MTTPLRIHRARANIVRPQDLTKRQLATRDRILAVAETLFGEFGFADFSFPRMAQALTIETRTLRRYFADLDELLATILLAHLQKLAATLAAIQPNTPNRGQKWREAYVAATHTMFGEVTDTHALLLKHRHSLPNDLAPVIQQMYAMLTLNLTANLGDEVMAQLDAPRPDLAAIESRLQAVAPPPPPPPPAPWQPDPAKKKGRCTRDSLLRFDGKNHEITRDWLEWDTPILQT